MSALLDAPIDPPLPPGFKSDAQHHTGPKLLPNLPPIDSEDDPSSIKIIGSYRMTKTLGQGTFGKVKEGIHLFTN
jgi:hypothetical protein